MHITRFPRVPFCHAQTALEFLPILNKHLGGNKTRKIEFLMEQARAIGNPHGITQDFVQSNHVRQTAAEGADPVGGGSEKFGRFVLAKMERCGKVIRHAGIKLE